MDNLPIDGRLDRIDDAIHASDPNVRPDVTQFTRITSHMPGIVSKTFRLKAGSLDKSVSANVSKGVAEVLSCAGLAQFADALAALQSNQCLVYGVPQTSPVHLLTEAAWSRAGRPAGSISRTEENFSWSKGAPGILMLDHDPQPGMQAYGPDDLVALLRQIPELAEVDMLTWPSASSLIYNGTTGECLQPMKGCRVYLMVDDASLVPAWGRYLLDALWAQGHGVFVVSSSGRQLERGLFDASVWQPSRLDFAAGAVCEAPLEQRRGAPLLHAGSLRVARAADGVAPRVSAVQQAAADAAKARARALGKPNAMEACARYSAEKERHLEATAVKAGQAPEVARARARAAVQAMLREESPELHGEALVTVVRPDGRTEELAVAEILARKAELDRAKTLDPLEPEYGGGRDVGMLFLSGPVPRLHSFAHGGTTYKLVTRFGEVELAEGSLHQSVDATVNLLRRGGNLYDHGDVLATVSADGRMVPITLGLLPYMLSSRIAFHSRRFNPRSGQWFRREEDPPQPVCKAIHELAGQRGLPKLNAVITAPVIVGRRLLDRPGYDEDSGLLVVLPGDEVMAPLCADIGSAKAAFKRLLSLFETFPFEGPADRGAFLAALFTAVMRPGLRTAPGFAFDAPAQGTGKSLLADCVSIVCAGSAPSALPHLYDDEQEVRKRLVSLLHAGVPVMIWDNIKGTFDSAVLAAMLTAERFNDRLLGETRLLSLPNRMLALFNGNNMALRGELTRRIFPCRLDAGIERPYLRTFSTNPRDVCLRERQAIVRDVLLIIKTYQELAQDAQRHVSLGSYEEWSESVLRPLLWLAELCPEAAVGSPLHKVQGTEEDDEDLLALAELHKAWHTVYGDEPKTAREVIEDMFDADFPGEGAADPWGALRSAVSDFEPQGIGSGTAARRAKNLGDVLKYRQGRVVDGRRRFRKHPQKAGGGVVRWVASLDGGGGSHGRV